MPREEEQRILNGYAAWDPRSSSTDELLDELHVTRATLYNVLQRNGVTPKTRRHQPQLSDAPPLSEGAMNTLMQVAVEDLYQGRVEAERLAEAAMSVLRDSIAAHPRTKQSEGLAEALRSLEASTIPGRSGRRA